VTQFEFSGVVEGFYGPAWSHADRLWILEQIGRWGMNRYIYAPKDDPLHRSRWREPYDARALGEFAELVERGAAAGVEVGFAISPGLSISYASAEDRAALASKFEVFVGLGARHAMLALDDVPTELQDDADLARFSSLGEAHVELASGVHEALGPDVSLCVVPTDYLGVEDSDYLEQLGAGLALGIDIAWTGRTIVSPTVETREAAARARVLKRRIVVWDNVPVSDGPMRTMLHMGPYTGRSTDLPLHVRGLLLNPMEHAHASAVALYSAARYAVDPEGYHAEHAWGEALEQIGSGAPEAFRLFAEAHRFSPLHTEDRDRELESRVAAISVALEQGEDFADLLIEVRELADRRVAVGATLRAELRDAKLLEEIEPWIESHETESRRIQAAITALLEILDEDERSERVFAFMRMEGRLSLEADNGRTSYGPRRVLYPQLTSMMPDRISLSVEPTLIRKSCLADEIVEFVEDLALFALAEDA